MTHPRIATLDWLRVSLILLVFLHHALMPFNGDDWHITNSEHSKLLDDIMVFFEQIRLPTLFFIAGAGTSLLLNTLSAWQFSVDKIRRLLLPLLVGMLCVVPIQHYYESPESYDSIIHAYQSTWLKFDANHLWFIEFLWVFMLLAAFITWIRGAFFKHVRIRLPKLTLSPIVILGLIAIVLVFTRVTLKAYEPSQDHDLLNYSVSGFYLSFFVFGVLAIKSRAVWQTFESQRRISLISFLIISVLFYGYYYVDFSPYLSLSVRWLIWWGMCTLVSYTALLTMMGFGLRYLRHSPPWLRVLNTHIFPFYIFHQSVIVVLGFYVVALPIGIFAKAALLSFSSLLVSSLLCISVSLATPLKWLFGLKVNKPVLSKHLLKNKVAST